MNGLTISLTAAEWQRHHDELSALLATQTGRGNDHRADPNLDRRIAELRSTFSRAVPAPADAPSPGTIVLGSRVTIRWADGSEDTLRLVAPAVATPAFGIISYQSPVGQAVLGRRAGERVAVVTPFGPDSIEIVAVTEPIGSEPAPGWYAAAAG